MDDNLKREIILDNFEHPAGKGLIDDDSYTKINMNNESCIDQIDIMLKIENNIIKDIHFDGEACAIATSTTSIMIKLLVGKTIDEAKKIINHYEKMINEEPYDETVLGEAIVYSQIYKQPNRIKCAMLPWKGMKKILSEKA